MDTKKIGTFLKELRLEEQLTQEQLGERLGVTNKTVSRWETGSYMPPIECLKLLSELYQVSINEIISGQRLGIDEYRAAAEDNMLLVLDNSEAEIKRFEKKMLIIMSITTLLTIAIIVLAYGTLKGVLIGFLAVALSCLANTTNLMTIVLRKNNRNRAGN